MTFPLVFKTSKSTLGDIHQGYSYYNLCRVQPEDQVALLKGLPKTNWKTQILRLLLITVEKLVTR